MSNRWKIFFKVSAFLEGSFVTLQQFFSCSHWDMLALRHANRCKNDLRVVRTVLANFESILPTSNSPTKLFPSWWFFQLNVSPQNGTYMFPFDLSRYLNAPFMLFQKENGPFQMEKIHGPFWYRYEFPISHMLACGKCLLSVLFCNLWKFLWCVEFFCCVQSIIGQLRCDDNV